MSEQAVPATGIGVKGATEVIEPSPRQRTIARRVAEARAVVPHFECSAEVIIRAREPVVESPSAFLVHACALALRSHPRVNGAYRDGRFEVYSRINIAVMIATEEAFVTPVLFDADDKPVGELDAELHRLGERARAGDLASPELSGATFTVCDLGAYGIAAAAAIPVAGQAAAVTAGAVREVPIAVDGALRPGRVMTISLACDDRILYPMQAASFLRSVSTGLQRCER